MWWSGTRSTGVTVSKPCRIIMPFGSIWHGPIACLDPLASQIVYNVRSNLQNAAPHPRSHFVRLRHWCDPPIIITHPTLSLHRSYPFPRTCPYPLDGQPCLADSPRGSHSSRPACVARLWGRPTAYFVPYSCQAGFADKRPEPDWFGKIKAVGSVDRCRSSCQTRA
jgi:hypothetical protein